jgi:oligopeptide transport system substrate-binding protein
VLPGVETVPFAQLADRIPWLPLDSQAVPGSYYYLFNTTTPPFDDVRVRKAFVEAVDRQALATLANSLGSLTRPATTFTPPETLGRDLYGQVGLPFDPAAAAALLEQAGYPAGEGVPAFKLVLGADATNEALANAVVSMWRANLGVEPEIEVLDLEDAEFFERLAADPGNVTVLGWVADYNDPDNFLYAAFDSGSDQRVGNFSNPSFDRLVRQAANLANDPAARQRLYVEAERLLADQAPILPIYHFIYTP